MIDLKMGLARHALGRTIVAVAASALIASCQSASAPTGPALTQLSGTETGDILYESRSPYDFVNMIDGSAPEVTVPATLTFPDGANPGTPVPAVIIMHDSAGVDAVHEHAYASMLNREGYATLVVDSYGARGIRSTEANQTLVTAVMMLADAYAGLNLLSSDPRIDGSKVAVMGFSKGGMVALYSSLEQVRKWFATGDDRFAAHVPIYPYCGLLPDETELTGAPVKMLLGGLDDYTPVSQCQTVQEHVDPEGTLMTLEIYKGAYHSFDGSWNVEREPFFNPSDCHFSFGSDGITRERGTGRIASTAEQRQEVLSDCGSMGITSGRNSQASAQARQDLKSFLSATF
ncbi:dienelactone hydrolase family protein [Pacificispira sp.]|uniref:dienelactone hydrolase family protein n=1 Tax=Pacificispira sp. TaxID=2888761 RepID=UPI003BAAE1CB